MRKRIHGKQSIPANILYSPERAMKLPTLAPVVPRCTKPPSLFPAPPTSTKAQGHSRTLYTSKALDQSNFII